MSVLVATAQEDEPLATEKLMALVDALEYLVQENDAEKLSYGELLDIDLMYNIIEGKY